jgi:hypothetical protein
MVMSNYPPPYPDIKMEMLMHHELHVDGRNNPVSLI